jgi:methylated-DNA-protein-cysteine methyltransferase-like protein
MAKQDLTAKAGSVAVTRVGEEAAAAIRAVVARIPPGQVSSYGEVAARAGLPGRARMIGKVLGNTPDGVELPWFRVLRSDGRIAFPPQSKAYREQRARLIEEGVPVERGRVELDQFGWERNLDFALWAPPPGKPAARTRAATAEDEVSRKRAKAAQKPARKSASAAAKSRTRPRPSGKPPR